MSCRDTFEIEAEVIRNEDDEGAILVLVDGEEVWIPRSQICDESEITPQSLEGETGTLAIPEWLAIKKELT